MIWGGTKFLPKKCIVKVEFCPKNKLVTCILFAKEMCTSKKPELPLFAMQLSVTTVFFGPY